jgi:hypothetical protein
MLIMNGPVKFAPPDKWAGNRPVFFTDGPEWDSKIAAKAWMMDPEGWSTTHAGASSLGPLTDSPSTPPAGGWSPVSWELPAYTGPDPHLQSAGDVAELQAQFGTAASNQANREMLSGTAPAPASTFIPPASLTVPKIADPNARFLFNGVTTDGAGNVLNVNRDQDKTMTAPATGPANPYVAPSDAQILPTSNTTATAVTIDWKKYLPIVLGLVLLIAIALALRSRSHAA